MTAQPLQRRRRVLVAGTVAALLVAMGALLVRVGAPEASQRDEQPARETTAGSSTRGRQDTETPASSGRDEGGAVTAALAYTAAPQRWLYLTDEQIAAAVEEIATPEAAGSLVAETVEEISVAREELAQTSGRVWWLVHPLAWRVESHSPDDATVAVWTVTVLSAARVALPQTEWLTVTVDLTWVDGNWRVDAMRDRPGPTPMTGPQDEPWNAQPFDEALEGFTRIDTEPVR
jgi:hypothetical protein